jgi:hypothetical protein
MTTKAEREAIKDKAIAELREMFPAGTTVYTVLRHRSQSGMSRSISVLEIKAPELFDVSYLVARATDDKLDHTYGGVKVSGAGMDMGFHLVYNLSHVLHSDGYALSHRWI